jgi:ABC-type transport system involved in multi-copper enzyme maturation permease subunit
MYTVLTLASFITEVEGADGMEMAGIEESLMLPDGLGFGSALVVGVGAVIMIIFAAGMYGSEFSWATIRMMLMMRAGRTQLVIAKLVMIGVMSLVVTVIGMIIVAAGSLGAEMVIEGSLDTERAFSGETISEFLLVTLRATVSVAMWALIGGMIALAFSSMAIGSGIALAGYFIGDLVVTLVAQVGTVGEWVSRLMPTYGINGLVQLNQTTGPSFSDAEIVGMVVSIIVWSAVFVALGIYRFKNADVVAASSQG